MKSYILLLFCLFMGLSTNLSAQSAAPQPENADAARIATDQLREKYKLNPDQAKQMYQIQQRKQRNMADIAGLKTSNPTLYRSKLQNVQSGTLGSIRRILKTKEQVELYEKTQRELRSKRAEKRKELAAGKTPKNEVEGALLEIYAE